MVIIDEDVTKVINEVPQRQDLEEPQSALVDLGPSAADGMDKSALVDLPPAEPALVGSGPEDLHSWTSTMAAALAPLTTWEETALLLPRLLESCPTRLGSCFRGEFWDTLPDTGVRTAPLGLSPGSSDLFPIDVELVISFCKSDLQISEPPLLCLMRLMIVACNYFSVAGWSMAPLKSKKKSMITSGQKGMIRHFVSCARRFNSLPSDPVIFDEVQKELLEKRIDYSGNVVSVRRDLVASKIIPTWPAVGEAATCSIETLLKGELLEDLSDPHRCLKPQSEWPEETPVSRVYASDAEWYMIVQAGYERGIFVEVPESDIFVNNLGDKVLSGAMGVDKVKETAEGPITLLRFISILCPINSYFRKLRGDSKHLPYLGQLSLALVSPEEQVIVDSEDMESCFNVYKTNDKWPGYFTFAKQVPQSAVGGDPNVLIWVGLATIPMGCQWAVDVAQALLRELVFVEGEIPRSTEVLKTGALPPSDVSICCLDGYDHIRFVKDALVSSDEMEPSAYAEKFRNVCRKLGIPMNHGKQVVKSVKATILGGCLVDGTLGVSPKMRSKMWWKSLALVSAPKWSEAMLLHWTGLAVFVSQFRRPLFSILQEVFHHGLLLAETPGSPWAESVDEILAFAALLPLAFANLRAPCRRTISCSDASEHGGGAGEAKNFCHSARTTAGGDSR